jgi:addiction module HigA family antidote
MFRLWTANYASFKLIKNRMRPVHPGEILWVDYLVPLQMSATTLSKALHATPALVNDIVRGSRGITPNTALRLARYFGGDAQSWLNLQQSYDLKIVEMRRRTLFGGKLPP